MGDSGWQTDPMPDPDVLSDVTARNENALLIARQFVRDHHGWLRDGNRMSRLNSPEEILAQELEIARFLVTDHNQ